MLWHLDPLLGNAREISSYNSRCYAIAATGGEVLEKVFYVRSVPRLYNEQQLRARERLETAVRRVGSSCETVAGQ
jgi:hypothetical protein